MADVQARVAGKKKKNRGLDVLLGDSIESRPIPNCGWWLAFFVSKVGGREGRFFHFD